MCGEAGACHRVSETMALGWGDRQVREPREFERY